MLYTKEFDKRFYNISSEHFLSPQDLPTRLAVLKRSISMVEIEVFSFCNRRCSFCPNKYIDRRSNNKYMPEALYLNILEQLQQFGYEGKISFSRYNEPLADRIILKRLAQARRLLPKCTLHTNTNGDFLSLTYLRELEAAGLNSLNIQAYLGEDVEYTEESVTAAIQKRVNATGLGCAWTTPINQEMAIQSGSLGNLTVTVMARNFKSNAVNRGELLSQEPFLRTSPCASPFVHFYIDYTGEVVPCCNIRSDAPEHADYVLGNLNSNSLQEIYFSENTMQWRRDLIYYSKNHRPPCKTCGFFPMLDTPEYLVEMQKIISKSGIKTMEYEI